MSLDRRTLLIVSLTPGVILASDQPTKFRRKQERSIAKRIEAIGGYVGRRNGRVNVVNLNGKDVDPQILQDLVHLPYLTDLSLESVSINDPSNFDVSRLTRLQWLNLYQSNVSDAFAKQISTLKDLEYLPIGKTRITDRGLEHLCKLDQLIYLGLRGCRVTDNGMQHIANMRDVLGLNLAETSVTVRGIQKLSKLSLQKLWIHDTTIGNESIPAIIQLRHLRELYIHQSRINAAGVEQIRQALPKCKIINHPN